MLHMILDVMSLHVRTDNILIWIKDVAKQIHVLSCPAEECTVMLEAFR